MERLTKKNKECYLGYAPIERLIKENNANPIISKLGQLEDIEGELGIDLVTLFKALTEDVYIKQGRKIIKVETPPILLNFDGEYYFEWHYEKLKNSFEQLSIKDYGKTWALTKEELQ